MKRDLKIILTLLLALALVFCTACTGGSNEPQPDPSPAPEPAPEPEPEPEPLPDYSAYNAEAEKAYREALQTFVDLGELPGGGEPIYYSGYEDGEWSDLYAILDIDGDGKDELVMRIAATTMASMQENIYAYDEETGELVQELWAFPVCDYFMDGLAVKSGWSHGTGTESDDFWPFNAFTYNPDTDEYDLAGYASQYYLPLMQETERADQFPAEADEDGNGIVYEISDGVNSPYLVDDEAYMIWYGDVLGWAPPMDMPWKTMDEFIHPNG